MSEESSNGMGRPGEPGGLTVQPAPEQVRTKRWIRILLALSLGVNLLIAGLVVGAYMHDHSQYDGVRRDMPPEARMLRELGLGPFLSAFPDQERRQLARAMREEVGTFKVNRETLAGELTAMLQAIRAEPYDHNALEAVIERQKERITNRAEAGRDVVLGVIENMSAPERAQFADRMERSMRRAMENVRAPGRP